MRNYTKNKYHGFEKLESRDLLSASHTAMVMGQEFDIPSWVAEENVARVSDLASQVTRTGEGQFAYTASTESYSVIGADDYQTNLTYSGYDGSGHSMVIIDSGADLDHPAFGPDRNSDGISDRIVYSYDFADDDSNANDVDGHGTHVAGIAAGVATGADLIILKVFPDSSQNALLSDIEDALTWVGANAATYNISTVNMSLGFGNFNTYEVGSFNDELAFLDSMGITTISASGNNYFSNGSTQGVAYPAAEALSLSVGATWDANEGGVNWPALGSIDYTTDVDRIASFSQRHSVLTDIFAPGALITSAGLGGGTSTRGGTSMAAPHVAASVTLLQQFNEDINGSRLDFQQVKDLLQNTGVTINDGDDEDDNVTNTGLNFERLDLEAAAQSLIPSVHVNSTADLPNTQTATGVTTLRSAIQDANALGTPISISLPEGHYTLNHSGTGVGNGELNDASFNDLDILGDITIVGAGAGRTVIDASGLSDRVFHVLSGSLNLSGLTVTGGTATDTNAAVMDYPVGGGIHIESSASLNLEGVVITDNEASIGGGIRAESGAIVNVVDSVFTNNTASVFGSALDAHNTSNVKLTIGSTIMANNFNTINGTYNLSITSMSPLASGSGSLGNNLIDDDYGSVGFFSGAGDLIENRDTVNRFIVTGTKDENDFANNLTSYPLREAILQANFVSGANEIWLPAWEHELTLSNSTDSSNASYNDLDINSDITIVGAGAGMSVIDATDINDRSFHVHSGLLSLDGVTLTGGLATDMDAASLDYPLGGAIHVLANAELSLNEVSITDNLADIGGAIRIESNAKANIVDSIFSDNTALVFGGAIDAHATSGVELNIGNTMLVNNYSSNNTDNLSLSNPSNLNTNSGSAGNNLLDGDVGSNFGSTTFFDAPGDVVAARDTERLLVTSLRDEIDDTNNKHSLSIREAILKSNEIDNHLNEVWIPAWDFTLTIDRGNSVTDTSARYGDLDITDNLIIKGVSNNQASVRWKLGVTDKVFELLGDYNEDGLANADVNAADYTVWQDNLGSTTNLDADGDDDGVIDQDDYDIWSEHYGNELDIFDIDIV